MEEIKIGKSPQGLERIKWLGPAFIWMLAAAGSGELLFTPRVAAKYGYTLLWAMIASVVFKWFINKEIGRYTVCSGTTIFRGFKEISGTANWVIWLITVPQLLVAVASVAGLAGGAATVFIGLDSTYLKMISIVIIVLSCLIIYVEQYQTLEKTTTVLAFIRAVAVLAAAISVHPDLQALGSGMIPQVPQNVQTKEVLPWLGFVLAGPAGLMWFSYWLQARGYGAAALNRDRPIEKHRINDQQKKDLRGWLTQLTIANTIAVLGALVIVLAFLILGTELLLAKNLVPEQNQIAETLGTLLESVWGRFGFYFMLVIIATTFFSTLISNQDGYARMFADGTKIIIAPWKKSPSKLNDKKLQRIYLVTVLGILPMVLYWMVGEPVGLLKLAGIIEGLQIPLLAGLVLYLNLKTLPEGLKPSWFSIAGTALAGFFFLGFAAVYLYELF